MQGIHLVKGRTFSCINPEHADKNPSCGIYLGNGNTPMFHCFSCGCAGSIFEAEHFIENKPLSGHGFLMDTVPYLASLFGVEIPRLDLNPEDLYEMETYQAYQHAAYIIRNSKPSERVQARLAEYSWPKEVLSVIGIGSVASYDDYLHKMTVTYGHKLEMLKDIDLARKGLFNENNLIYTVKDEHGSPVGFAARDLRYEEKRGVYEKQVAELSAQFGADKKSLKAAVDKLFKPRKYNNSAESEYIRRRDAAEEYDLQEGLAPVQLRPGQENNAASGSLRRPAGLRHGFCQRHEECRGHRVDALYRRASGSDPERGSAHQAPDLYPGRR